MPSTGTPESKIACGARGDPASCTDSGPPERITAFGFISWKAASAFWNGTISELTQLIAYPARNELRHLAAEIDNQNLVMRRGHRGHRLAGGLGWGHGQAITRRRS